MHRYDKWKPFILAARTEAELIRVMAEFCAVWLPSDLEKLPRECQRCEVRTAEDISELAVAFTTAELRVTDPVSAETLAVLSRTFILASQQLRRLGPSQHLGPPSLP